jgi:hypothetical protein
MYQVTLFDEFGAIVKIEQFLYHKDAMAWMIDTATINASIAKDTGRDQEFTATHWELTQAPREVVKQPSVPKSKSQARRLAHQRKIR